VRFVGEPIASVFAPTVAEAEDMADRVEIEIAESPAVVNASDAMSPDAPCVHDIGNVVVDGAKRRCVLSARTRRDLDMPVRLGEASVEIGSLDFAWRHRARNRQRALGRSHLRHARQYPDGDARRLLPPTAREIPAIELHHIETPAASSLTGAKGLGEGGTIGAPAAILNAVNDALSPFGISIDEMPATPQRIRAALRSGITNRQLVIRYQ